MTHRAIRTWFSKSEVPRDGRTRQLAEAGDWYTFLTGQVTSRPRSVPNEVNIDWAFESNTDLMGLAMSKFTKR